MKKEPIVAVTSFGNTLIEIFLYPGQQIAALLGVDSPDLPFREDVMAAAGFDPLPLILSMLVWLLAAVGLVRIYRRFLILLRRIGDFIDGLSLRARLGIVRVMHTMKKILTLGRFASDRDGVSATSIDLDDTDVAVLKIAKARCPGLAISAPDLASQLHARPVTIQRRLQRLAGYQLLENVIGSTDGFDNYTLTPAGSVFVRKLP